MDGADSGIGPLLGVAKLDESAVPETCDNPLDRCKADIQPLRHLAEGRRDEQGRLVHPAFKIAQHLLVEIEGQGCRSSSWSSCGSVILHCANFIIIHPLQTNREPLSPPPVPEPVDDFAEYM